MRILRVFAAGFSPASQLFAANRTGGCHAVFHGYDDVFVDANRFFGHWKRFLDEDRDAAAGAGGASQTAARAGQTGGPTGKAGSG